MSLYRFFRDGYTNEAARAMAADVGGSMVNPSLIVLHYTAGGADDGSLETLTQKDERYVSAHFLIGRDGRLYQTVPINKQAWHAGASEWKGRAGCNAYSIGIEMSNWGYLEKQVNGHYYAWPNHFRAIAIPEKLVIEAMHKNGGPTRFWEAYPDAQIQTCARLCASLKAAWPTLSETVGHEDIAPKRKTDPGPAFPWEKFKTLVASYSGE